jgi:hypothetical protein
LAEKSGPRHAGRLVHSITVRQHRQAGKPAELSPAFTEHQRLQKWGIAGPV